MKRRAGGEKWKPIIFDKDGNEVEDGSDFSPARFRIYAVKVLGYSHREVGFRTMAELDDEICEYEDMIKESREDRESREIYD